MATHSSIVARRIPWTEISPAALHKLPAGAPCPDQAGERGRWLGCGVRGTGQMISRIRGPVALTLLIVSLQISASRGRRSSTCRPSPEQVTIHLGDRQPCARPPTPPPSLCTLGRSHWVSGPRRRLREEVMEVSGPHISCNGGDRGLSPFKCVPSSGLNKPCSGDTDAHKRPEAGEGGGLQRVSIWSSISRPPGAFRTVLESHTTVQKLTRLVCWGLRWRLDSVDGE